MSRSNLNDVRCEALFASGLQRSDAPTTEEVAEAISRTIRQIGSRGCTAQMAQEFGDHPESAVIRMRWARQIVDDVFAPPVPRRLDVPSCRTPVALCA
jgi:hypothetical protein